MIIISSSDTMKMLALPELRDYARISSITIKRSVNKDVEIRQERNPGMPFNRIEHGTHFYKYFRIII